MGRPRLAKIRENCAVDMTRFVKTVLLWLLIAALPLQGIAAAVKAACGPEHHETISSNIMSSHEAMPDEEHAHHTMVMNDAGNPSDHGSKSQHQHKSAFCSSCAACCVGAVAPPVSLKQPSPPTLSETAHVLASPWIAGFIPAGPERPPRHLSA